MAHSRIASATVPFLIFWVRHFTVSTVCLLTVHIPTTVIVRTLKFLPVPFLFFGVMHSTISTVCSRTLHIATTVIVRVAKDRDCHTMNVREVNFSTIITVKLKQIKIDSQI